MQLPQPGFRHRNLIVDAIQYELATFPRSYLIVRLDERGDSHHTVVTKADFPQSRPGRSRFVNGSDGKSYHWLTDIRGQPTNNS